MGLREGLTFTRSQKLGILVSLAVIALVLAWRHWHNAQQGLPPSWQPQQGRASTVDSIPRLDINTAESVDFRALPGIGNVLSKRILRYREARGGFTHPEDLKNVYGLRPEVLDALMPYLYVDTLTLPAPTTRASRRWPRKQRPTYATRTNQAPEPLDINAADSAAFRSLPGIGPVLSQRIVKFRESRGGFRAVEDVQQVYGLKPEVFERLRPYLLLDSATLPGPPAGRAQYASRAAPQAAPSNRAPAEEAESVTTLGAALAPVDLNQADSTQLEQLPGIGPKLAVRILKYREILGYYAEVEQLRGVYGLSEENFQRMAPYLVVKAGEGGPKQDLNMANAWQLRRFSVISDSLAQAILARRKQLGWFESWDQLQAVPGVGEAQLRRLQQYFFME